MAVCLATKPCSPLLLRADSVQIERRWSIFFFSVTAGESVKHIHLLVRPINSCQEAASLESSRSFKWRKSKSRNPKARSCFDSAGGDDRRRSRTAGNSGSAPAEPKPTEPTEPAKPSEPTKGSLSSGSRTPEGQHHQQTG